MQRDDEKGREEEGVNEELKGVGRERPAPADAPSDAQQAKREEDGAEEADERPDPKEEDDQETGQAQGDEEAIGRFPRIPLEPEEGVIDEAGRHDQAEDVEGRGEDLDGREGGEQDRQIAREVRQQAENQEEGGRDPHRREKRRQIVVESRHRWHYS